MIDKIINKIIGEPLANEQSGHEKYNIPFGLAIMASDAISSVAYAAQEILIVLLPVLGLMSYGWLSSISLLIIGLLAILTISYMQIIKAYPQGGGAYIVAKENISTTSGLVAGSALSLDYILTVAVSASAGIAAITSAFPDLFKYKVSLTVGLIIILTILNLRGVSESAKIFSIPTYIFIGSMFILIGWGIAKYFIYGMPSQSSMLVHEQLKMTGMVGIFLIMKAFSSGCSALTGLEAVSNSVPNFKEPGQRNAKIVMVLLSTLILLIFGGSALLTMIYHPFASKGFHITVLAQLAYGVFGKTFMFYVIQFSTAIILLMACNTAFTGFPMLMSVISRDGFMPRQFAQKGQRLSYSAGIMFLACIAIILAIIFKADTDSLIPLYSVGVFLSFTLAQIGMVIHWKNSKEKNSKKGILINGFGAFITAIVTGVIIYEKAFEGAWIILVLIPILVYIMKRIKAHYNYVADSIRIADEVLEEATIDVEIKNHVIIPIASINKTTIAALQYARSISEDVIAFHIGTSTEEIEKLKYKWTLLKKGNNIDDIMLIAKYSPYRKVAAPLLQYINRICKAAGENERVTVVLPQFIVNSPLAEILHNHTTFFLKEALLKENVVITIYPYHLNYGDREIVSKKYKKFRFKYKQNDLNDDYHNDYY